MNCDALGHSDACRHHTNQSADIVNARSSTDPCNSRFRWAAIAL